MQLRKDHRLLVYGKYTLLDKTNPKVYAFTREQGGGKMLILLNFSATTAQTVTGLDTAKLELVSSNYKDAVLKKNRSAIVLRPYEAIICRL